MGNVFFRLVSITLISSITLSGCSNQNNNMNMNEKNKHQDFKIGIVINKSDIKDRSFNQAAWEAFEETAKKYDWKENKNFKRTVAKTAKDYEKQLTKFANDDYDLIVGVGAPFQNAIKKVAEKKKKSNFLIIDGIVEKPNVVSIKYHEEQSSFLAGIVAGMSTKTKKVGFLGGVKSEGIKRYEYGYKAGVMSVDEKIKVISKFANSFDKPEQAKKLASAMYSKGADIIYHAAGLTGLGVFEEAKQRKKNGEKVWVIGNDRNQFKEGMPENVTLSSTIKKIDEAVKQVVAKTLNGNFQGGRILRYGIKENGVELSDEKKNLNKKTLEQVKLYEENIKKGKIVVPATKEEFDKFTPKKPEKQPETKKVKITK